MTGCYDSEPDVSTEKEMKNEILSKVVSLINNVMGYIDLFEPNRPASIAVTKLEEAVMWSQVMIANVALKPETQEKIDSLKKELKDKKVQYEVEEDSVE
jgi:hypothetical protein